MFNAIGNEISDFLKFTADWPSANESRYMALLDIQIRVVDNKIEYLFYSKPMVNPIKMRRDSAMPLKIQRESLVNMALTRLRNTKRELHAEHMPGILSKFSNEMKLSGHDAKFRLEVIQSAVRGYERQCDRADRGITPLHRPRSFEREKRRRKALLTKTSWYRPANSVIRVPATPDSELVNTINEIVKKRAGQLGLKVKTVEKAGSKIKDQLCKLDTTGCYWPDCYGCRTGEGGGSHTRRGAWYTGVCTPCGEAGGGGAGGGGAGNGGQGGAGKHVVYHGESGRSAYYRWKLHEAAVEDGDLDNAFAKHTAIFHQDKAGDPSIYKMTCVKTFPKSLERQVSEGQAITDSAGAAAGLGGGGGQKADYLMNSRAEYRLPAVQRVTLTRQVRERASGS